MTTSRIFVRLLLTLSLSLSTWVTAFAGTNMAMLAVTSDMLAVTSDVTMPDMLQHNESTIYILTTENGNEKVNCSQCEKNCCEQMICTNNNCSSCTSSGLIAFSLQIANTTPLLVVATNSALTISRTNSPNYRPPRG